jgi:hypothetical protein
MKTTVLVVAVVVMYVACMYSVRPSVHVSGLDGPTATCKNPYHTHHK